MQRSKYRTALITAVSYTTLGQQVTFTYSPVLLEPPMLLEAYGMAFSNNVFAGLSVTNPNALQELDSQAKLRLLELIKDVSDYEPKYNEDTHTMIFQYKISISKKN